MNNSIAANTIQGKTMRRIITVDNVVELTLSDNDPTEMNTIFCKTTPSKMLRILLSYGYIMCINATSMFVVSNKTCVVLSLDELIIIIKTITLSRQIM